MKKDFPFQNRKSQNDVNADADVASTRDNLLEFDKKSNQESSLKNPIYYSCYEIECEAGGTCILDETQEDNRIRCRCPLGRGGFFCEKRKFLYSHQTDQT